MNSEQNTLPTLETIAAMLGEMRRETNEHFDRMEQRIDRMEQRIDRMEQKYDQKFEDMRLQMMSFDVRIDRLEAIGHECLNVAFNVRADVKVLREDYLYQIENATNHYETLAVAPNAALEKIKQAYFTLAKQFHPDLFYKKTDAKLFGRIQRAFTEFAQAYETLKTESSREVYDYRMRKELAKMKTQTKAESSSEDLTRKQVAYAAENFEHGFSLLIDDHHKAALPFLARAVHFAQNNARYHAYHGKALSFDDRQRHKAEAELQTAIKLDAENADFRLMLAEFFIQIGFPKRAEGELNRLLSIFPSNREAQALLDSLAKV